MLLNCLRRSLAPFLAFAYRHVDLLALADVALLGPDQTVVGQLLQHLRAPALSLIHILRKKPQISQITQIF